MENYTKKEVNSFGTIRYYNASDKLHRLDGPAVERWDGSKGWHINGKLHRLDGPAVEYSKHFKRHKAWWVKGKEYLKSCHNRLVLFFILEPQRIDINPTEK